MELLPLGTAWAALMRRDLNSPLGSGTGWEPPSQPHAGTGGAPAPTFLPEGQVLLAWLSLHPKGVTGPHMVDSQCLGLQIDKGRWL